MMLTPIEEAYQDGLRAGTKAGLLAGLQKAELLIPEESAFPWQSIEFTNWQIGFNEVRSLILSRIKEEKEKL